MQVGFVLCLVKSAASLNENYLTISNSYKFFLLSKDILRAFVAHLKSFCCFLFCVKRRKSGKNVVMGSERRGKYPIELQIYIKIKNIILFVLLCVMNKFQFVGIAQTHSFDVSSWSTHSLDARILNNAQLSRA